MLDVKFLVLCLLLIARALDVHALPEESLAELPLKAVDVLHANSTRTIAAGGVVQDTGQTR